MIRSSILAVAKKEVFHIVRDPFTLTMALGMPVVMVLFFGLAIEFNLDKIPIAIFDGSKTTNSRDLIQTFSSSKYFIPKYVFGPAQALQLVDEGAAQAALIIPPTYARELTLFRQSSVQILVDGTDNSSAGSILGYLGGLQVMALKKEFGAQAARPVVDVKSRFLYNSELNSRWFVVPGLAAVVIAVLSILLTALTVAREWENGSMELLLGTPIRPIEIILGKLLPYCVMGLVAALFVFMMSQIVFEVPFRGNFLIYLFACLIFLSTYLAQGLLISVITRKQQLSMQFSMLTGLLPTLLLSGFIFPTEHMPSFFYYLTMLLPARWFISISRKLFLQGASFFDVLPSLLVMCILLMVMILLATKKFKKDVEP
ncbi:ABC transporter permease [Bdellovibrio svalbardensis]|uniref:ABC transporter permease n=1 Tax=Bdellovibrio svalbardensis TaxID=2972972 RepID=A0ABT6DIP3_9BACT|nr:ABC transporter permease [Bdellovibrio svalbardensis]MDG0816702.1 ABC transporter permease [Bdellovibrio svalbardensis]